LFRGGGKIFAGNGAEPVDPKADNELAISKGGADVLTFLHPFSFPGGPGEALFGYRPTYTVMHLQIVEAERQLTGRYVASEPHYWAMWMGLTESRGAGGTDQAAGC